MITHGRALSISRTLWRCDCSPATLEGEAGREGCQFHGRGLALSDEGLTPLAGGVPVEESCRRTAEDNGGLPEGRVPACVTIRCRRVPHVERIGDPLLEPPADLPD